jgi:DNA-binding Lrp family transcriptional regulator
VKHLLEELAKLSGRPKIDQVDVWILKALLQDPRTSFAEIAENCGRSTNAIRMRFKRLTKEGIINGAIMQVNPKSLGYNCIALLGVKADANEETSVYDFVESIPEIIKSFQPIGKYSVLSFAALKGVDALAHTVEQVNSHQYVSEVEECIWIDVVRMDHPENLLIQPFDDLSHTTELLSKNENPKTTIIPPVAAVAEEKHLDESRELDKIDMSIINILSENASLSFRKVAKQLGISTQAVIRRYNRLKKDVLPYSSITVNLKKLGYDGTAIFYIKTLHQHAVSTVFDEILRIPNVIVACKCLGAFDIFVAVPFSNFEQLLKQKQGIAKTPGVKQMEVFIDKPFLRWPLNLFTQFFHDKSKPVEKRPKRERHYLQ